MEFIYNTLKTLYVVAIFQALLIAVYLLFQKKGNPTSRKILAFLLIDFCIFLSGTMLLLFFSKHSFVYLGHLSNLSVFLAAPLLYLYLKSLTQSDFKFTFNMLAHTLPFIWSFSIMSYEFVTHANRFFLFKPFGIGLLAALFLQSIFYLWISFRQKEIFLSKNDIIKSKWFKGLFLSVFLIFILKLIIFILWNIFGLADICIYVTGILFILSFIVINLLVLFALYYPETLVHHSKYQNSPISQELKDIYYNELLKLLSEKRIYSDPLLKLSKVAKPLNVSEKKLSQIINENSGNNFNDFINQYRIREAERLINENKELNILQIAYEVGFNSKSTFNSAFKKFTGFTPSAYRRK